MTGEHSPGPEHNLAIERTLQGAFFHIMDRKLTETRERAFKERRGIKQLLSVNTKTARVIQNLNHPHHAPEENYTFYRYFLHILNNPQEAASTAWSRGRFKDVKAGVTEVMPVIDDSLSAAMKHAGKKESVAQSSSEVSRAKKTRGELLALTSGIMVVGIEIAHWGVGDEPGTEHREFLNLGPKDGHNRYLDLNDPNIALLLACNELGHLHE